MRALPTLTILISLMLLPHHLSSTNARFGLAGSNANYPVLSFQVEAVPTIAFCELVKNPQPYFDKTVRVTAVIKTATEGIYLSDDRCVPNPDEQVGVGTVGNDETQRDTHNRKISEIRSSKYGSRARVTLVGTLRNSPSRMVFAPSRYRFDIISFEDISQVIVPYEGTLQEGMTYRADVRGDSISGLSLVRPLRARPHVAVRIEWTNLDEFPALARPGGSSRERQIIFSVISDKTSQIAEGRRNRTLECKILRLN